MLGGLAAVAAVVLLVVVLGSGGGSDDDNGGGGSGSGNGGGSPIGAEDDAGGGDVTGGSAEGEVAQAFLDAVNSGDEATAIGMLCASSPAEEEITAAVAADASIEIDPATVDTDGAGSFGAVLVGTVDGAPIGDDSYVSTFDEDAGTCVYCFDLGRDFPPDE